MKQRPLVICSIAFLIGILLSFYGFSGLITFLMIASLFTAYLIKKNKLKFLAVLLVIVLFGAGRMELAQLKKEKILTNHAGKKGEISLVIAEPSTNGKAIAFLPTPEGNVGVYLSSDKRCEVTAGDIVTGEMTIHIPLDTKTGARGFSNSLASRNVFLQASCDEVRKTGRYEKGIMGKIYSLRAYANELGRKTFRGDDRALFNAMVFGDKTHLSDELYASLQGSGLNHIAVVSGMHLSVIIAFLVFIIRKIFGKGRIGFFIAIICAIFITLLTGAGASIVRALVMCLIYYLARILYRESDGATSLFATVFIMAFVNPYIIFNTGFALSVLAVLGIILYSRRFSTLFRLFLPEKMADALSLTLASQLALTPIIVYYFGVITPYAPFSNLFAVPLSSLYVVLGMILTLASPIKPIAAAISFIMRLLSIGIINLCENVSKLPAALIECGDDFLLFSVLWIFIAVVVFYCPIPVKRLKMCGAIMCALGVIATFVSRIEYDHIFFTPYGGETLAYADIGTNKFLIDCPDIFDAASLDDAYRQIVLTKRNVQEAFNMKRRPRKVYIPIGIFDMDNKDDQKEIRDILRAAKACKATVVFKKDGDIFTMGDARVRYIDAGVKRARAVEINFRGRKVISLQGFSQSAIEMLVKNRVKFECDYIYLPYTPDGCEALSDGEIILNNKFSLQR